ncbi:MAG: SAP domain-containing protein [Bacteroidales bacterium]|nr:SAP domain-containing protein [Bacteroidales bacterium]
MMNNRPELNTKISIQDFKDFYWYKEELIDFCRSENLDKRDGKIELAKRIEKYLQTGERVPYHEKSSKTSRFDWNTAKLAIETEITDNYKNTENVREFFKNQLGDKFKFNVKFMNWMKTAQGKTLGDAIEQWILITNKMRTDKTEKQIAPQFEYNTYVRDFMKDNPDKLLQDAINSWKIKKSKPGDNKYTKTDFK